MIFTAIFVFTAAMLILGSVKLTGAILGNGVTMPPIIPGVDMGPTHFVIMHPSLLFQVWFWTDNLGVLV